MLPHGVSLRFFGQPRVINRLKAGECDATSQSVPADDEVATFFVIILSDCMIPVHDENLNLIVDEQPPATGQYRLKVLQLALAWLQAFICLTKLLLEIAIDIADAPIDGTTYFPGECLMHVLPNGRMRQTVRDLGTGA